MLIQPVVPFVSREGYREGLGGVRMRAFALRRMLRFRHTYGGIEMKRTILALCLIALVFGAAGTSLAGSNDNWTIYMKAADSNGGNYIASQCQFGTLTTATDSPAEFSTGNDAANGVGSGKAAVLACFDLIGGAHVPGFWGFNKDMRAPITTGQKIWNLHIWVQSNWTAGDLVLTAWNNAGSLALNGSFPVILKVVNDPTGTYAAGTTLYTFNGTGSMPAVTFTNTNAIKGTSGYVQLQLIAGGSPIATPEPGSMAAMLSMIGGFSGIMLRRKRKS